MSLKANRNIYLGNARSQSGSALVIAVFIMVVVLGFGVTMSNILVSSSESVAYEVLGTRAYLAANSGAQQQLNILFQPGREQQLCNGNGIASVGADLAEQAPEDRNDTISNVALLNCRVSEVSCINFKDQGITYYRIESTGKCTISGGEEVSRTVRVEARS